MDVNYRDYSHTFSNGVTVVNTTPHPLSFLSPEGEKVTVPCSVPEGGRTGPAVVDARPVEKELAPHIVDTGFVPSPEGGAVIRGILDEFREEASHGGLMIVGSMIAANTYPEVVGMCPAPGYERMPPQDKLMDCGRFAMGGAKMDLEKMREAAARLRMEEKRIEEKGFLDKLGKKGQVIQEAPPSVVTMAVIDGVSGAPSVRTAVWDFSAPLPLAPDGMAWDVRIADGVREIPRGAFRMRNDVICVNIPGSVESIGAYAFDDCSALEHADLGDGIRHIGEGAFSCTALKGISIPGSVKEIGRGAFSCCKALGHAELGNGVRSIGELAFNDTALGEIRIPESVEEIGPRAFRGCGSLEHAKLGRGVRHIGNEAFKDTALKEISIPDNVYRIGDCAFRGCGSLEHAELGQGVRHIGGCAFADTALKEISIPENVKGIGLHAFPYGADVTRHGAPSELSGPEECGHIHEDDGIEKREEERFRTGSYAPLFGAPGDGEREGGMGGTLLEDIESLSEGPMEAGQEEWLDADLGDAVLEDQLGMLGGMGGGPGDGGAQAKEGQGWEPSDG